MLVRGAAVDEMYSWIKHVVDEDTTTALTNFATTALVRCDKLSDPLVLYAALPSRPPPPAPQRPV